MGVPQSDYWDAVSIFTTIILGIVATVTSIVLYKKSIKKKILTYKVLSDTSVVSVHKEIEKSIEISYQRLKVTQLRLVEIRIKNSGTEVINEEDFRNQPLTFCKLYDKNSKKKLLASFWDVVSIFPENIKAELDMIEGKIGLKPLMINPTEIITVKFLIGLLGESQDIKIKPEGRIAGTTLIEEKLSDKIPVLPKLKYFIQGASMSLPVSLIIYSILFIHDISIIVVSSIFLSIVFSVFIIENWRLFFVAEEKTS